MSPRAPAPTGLTLKNINPHLLTAQYAVRGELATRAESYRARLAESGGDGPAIGLPFNTVISANIGNPQQLGQKPISFFRRVASLIENPELLDGGKDLLDKTGYRSDVVDRANWLLGHVQSVGAYSHSQGVPAIRQKVADFIAARDGFPADPNSIFLTAGASAGVSTMLYAICASPSTGVLVPIPQYPLYTASLSLLNGRCVPYYLDESTGWSTSTAEIEKSFAAAVDDPDSKTDIRALVVINPGNPTGSTLTADLIEKIILFAAQHRLVVIADEVYQTNVFSGSFVSFKKVLRQMETAGKVDAASVELVSLHSVSKGMVGECGHRAGYMELVNFPSDVVDQIYKYVSIQLCPSVLGQCVLEMMVNPPKQTDPSGPEYEAEHQSIYTGLADRARALWTAFSKMESVDCQEPKGAMYLFPTIKLPAKAESKAKEEHRPADEYYCLRLLDATGICVVPGSGFGQRQDTLHLRTTFLAPGTDWIDRWVRFHSAFMAEFR